MLVFRILCAILVAWAINWTLSRPEAAAMLRELPQMAAIGPLAGALVGYFNLAVRQGWGFVVAVSNGIWSGVLSVILSGGLFIAVDIVQALRQNQIHTFEQVMRLIGDNLTPLFDLALDFPLLTMTVTATASAGVLSEGVHWTLVRLRRRARSET